MSSCHAACDHGTCVFHPITNETFCQCDDFYTHPIDFELNPNECVSVVPLRVFAGIFLGVFCLLTLVALYLTALECKRVCKVEPPKDKPQTRYFVQQVSLLVWCVVNIAEYACIVDLNRYHPAPRVLFWISQLIGNSMHIMEIYAYLYEWAKEPAEPVKTSSFSLRSPKTVKKENLVHRVLFESPGQAGLFVAFWCIPALVMIILTSVLTGLGSLRNIIVSASFILFFIVFVLLLTARHHQSKDKPKTLDTKLTINYGLLLICIITGVTSIILVAEYKSLEAEYVLASTESLLIVRYMALLW
jgi:hypothetical protein